MAQLLGKICDRKKKRKEGLHHGLHHGLPPAILRLRGGPHLPTGGSPWCCKPGNKPSPSHHFDECYNKPVNHPQVWQGFPGFPHSPVFFHLNGDSIPPLSPRLAMVLCRIMRPASFRCARSLGSPEKWKVPGIGSNPKGMHKCIHSR